jgi:uncharacterized phage protein (TIGR02218 family)
MKTIPIALAAHYQQEVTTLAYCLKITNRFGDVGGFTSHDQLIQVGVDGYSPGFDLSSLASSASLAVDNMELTIFPPTGQVLNNGLIVGRWDNSAVEIFEVNYNDTSVINVLKRGTLGQVQFKDTHWVIEFRSLAQALQQTQGIVTQKTCRARLGDAKCTLDVTPFTVTGTIDSSADRRSFVDAARTEADDYFAEGLLTITASANAAMVGLEHKVKTNAAGVFQLSLPMPFDMSTGDTYSMVAGCMKRLTEDCKTKFANVVNFQGEPDLPGLDALTKQGAATTQPASTPALPAEGNPDTGSGGGGE